MPDLDLDAIFAEVENLPSRRLARFSAIDVYCTGKSPAYDLILLLDGEPVAFVRQDGRTQTAKWYALADDSTPATKAQERLESAAGSYLDLPPAHGADVVLAGLAGGAHNGCAACLMWRTLIGD